MTTLGFVLQARRWIPALLASALVASACAPSATVQAAVPFVGSAAYTGPIHGVAVVMSSPQERYRELADSAYSYMVTTFATHPYARARYDVIERSEIERILEEHRLGSSGFVDPSTAPRLGQLLGAQYIVVVDLVSADIRDSGVQGLKVGGITLGGGAATVSVTMSTRMVDVTTGRVLATGMGSVSGTSVTGLSVEGTAIGTEATLGAAIDLFPEAAMRSLNALFRRLG